MLKKRKEKTPKNEPYTEVNNYEKWQASHRGIEEFFNKNYTDVAYGMDVA